MHVVGVKISAFIQPSEIVEADRIDNERIGVPTAHRISIKRHVLSSDRIVAAAVGWNDPEIIRLRASSRGRIKKDHLVTLLNNLRWRPHAWYAVGLALEDRIQGVGVTIEVLNLIPKFRFVEGPVGIHSSCELAVDGLICLIFTSSLVGCTPARCNIRREIAAVLGGAVDADGRAVPKAGQVRMALRGSRRRNRS